MDRRPWSTRLVAVLALAALQPACMTTRTLRGEELPPAGLTWDAAGGEAGGPAAGALLFVANGDVEVEVAPPARLVVEGDQLAIHGPAGVQRLPIADAVVEVHEPAHGRTVALIAGLGALLLIATYESPSRGPGPGWTH